MSTEKPREYVYFIQAEEGGPIKIGSAKDPVKRLMELQCANPALLVLRHRQAAPCASRTEVTLHALFASLRIRGEWFRPHPVLANIGRCIPDESLADEPFVYPEHVDHRWNNDSVWAASEPEAHEAKWDSIREQQAISRDWFESTKADRDKERAAVQASDRPITARPHDFEGDGRTENWVWRGN